MKKKILAFIFVIIMFILVASVDTVENTNANDIASAKIQAQCNKESRGR